MRQTIGQVSINSSFDSSSWARLTPPANETNIFKINKWSWYVTSTASLPKPIIKTQLLTFIPTFLGLYEWNFVERPFQCNLFDITRALYNFLRLHERNLVMWPFQRNLFDITCALHQFFDSNLQTAFLPFFVGNAAVYFSPILPDFQCFSTNLSC